MQIKIFTIPVQDSDYFINEMNRFMQTNRILEVEQHFYNNGDKCFWAFCIHYLEYNQGMTSIHHEKVDYKQVLDEAHFDIFSKLREIRKRIAMEDAVPAFAVFIDEELANISIMKEINSAEMKCLKGIGEKRMIKYGEKLISLYHEA